MGSKVNLTFNVLLAMFVIVIANLIRLKVPLNNEFKRSLGYHPDSLLNFTELSGRHGFLTEEHDVITEDGFILSIFRMRSKKCDRLKRPPVILMHGLLQSADAWLDAGPKAGLAYLLADACYDVWIGNQRGNYYGRKHVRLDPDIDREFWEFSVDEIGFYDIPATIDYVLKGSGEIKLNYIGFSQGSGSFFIMCSERPGYCDKVNILIALAPATRMTHMKSVPFKILANTARNLEGVLATVGFYELLPKGSIGQEFLAFVCKFAAISESGCGSFLSITDSFHSGSITSETLRVLFGHYPAGTSVHTLARYGQGLWSEKFQKFDYGEEKNLNIYGDRSPPAFNLTAANIPIVVLYGKNDYLVNPKDIMWLVNQLPNVLEAVEVSEPLWNHFDVTYSQYTNRLIFPTVNHYLSIYRGS